MCTKTSSCSFRLPDVYSLRLLAYRDLLLRPVPELCCAQQTRWGPRLCSWCCWVPPHTAHPTPVLLHVCLCISHFHPLAVPVHLPGLSSARHGTSPRLISVTLWSCAVEYSIMQMLSWWLTIFLTRPWAPWGSELVVFSVFTAGAWGTEWVPGSEGSKIKGKCQDYSKSSFFIVLGDERHSDLLSVKIQLRGLELYELCSYLSLSLLNTGLHPV